MLKAHRLVDWRVRLPNAERAIIDIAKLRDYCLNPEHPRGKHKARVFQRTLGLTQEDAAWLQAQLYQAALHGDVRLGQRDRYGQRYQLDTRLETRAGSATLRSSWIVLAGEDRPRLSTCYVL